MLLFGFVVFIVHASIFCLCFSQKQSANQPKKIQGNGLLLNWKAHAKNSGTFAGKKSRLRPSCTLLSLFPILAWYMCKSSIKYCTILKMSLLIHLGVWVLRHNTVWKLSSLIINRTRLIPLLWSLICPWSWVHLIYIEHIMSLINSLTLELSSLQGRRISTLESNIHERVQSARKESLTHYKLSFQNHEFALADMN